MIAWFWSRLWKTSSRILPILRSAIIIFAIASILNSPASSIVITTFLSMECFFVIVFGDCVCTEVAHKIHHSKVRRQSVVAFYRYCPWHLRLHRSCLVISSLKFPAAICSSVLPLLSLAFTFAPSTLAFQFSVAIRSGVLPYLLLLPILSSHFLVAKCSGILPSLSLAFTSTRNSLSRPQDSLYIRHCASDHKHLHPHQTRTATSPPQLRLYSTVSLFVALAFVLVCCKVPKVY